MGHSRAYGRFQKKIEDVSVILEIHSDVSGRDKGRRPEKLKVLHKSGIALLVASWETYVEELIKDAIVFILNSSLDPRNKEHLEISSTIITNAESKLKNFNTPNSGNVLNEFRILGISDIRNSWSRQGMNSKRAIEVLDELLAKRHKIVHGHLSDPTYNKSDLKYYKQFIEITAQKTDDYVRNHLYILTSVFSW